jgi:hypothetical protein
MWVTHVSAARQAQATLPASQFHEVRYEQLHSNGPAVLRRIIDWLGLEWSNTDIERALERNAPEAARAGKGTPIPLGGQFASTVGTEVKEPAGFIRKARAGTWREDLTPLDKVAVWRAARSTMAAVGYPWSAPWSS